jgi:hypothetical protein
LAPQEGLEPTTLRLTAGANFVNRKSQLPVLYDRDRKINS